MTDFSIIGTGVAKRDGADKVTGRTHFLHDLVLPRMAHGKILRARIPHARIRRIDTARARALPGVLAVITGDDVEQHPFGFAKDQLALKRGQGPLHPRRGRGRGGGDRATIAEEALELIDVEYEELPAVFDPLRGRAARAPRWCTTSWPTNLTALRYQFTPRRRRPRVRRGRGDRRGRVSAELRDARVPGNDGGHRGLGPAGPADDVVHHPGAVPLPARPRAGARHHRRPRAGAAAAGRRQLRARPRSLPDRRDRRAAGASRAAAGEDRVRADGGVRRVSHARAVPIRCAPRPTPPAGCSPATPTWSSTTAPTSRGARPRRT